jgi:hypothetical protein
MPGWRYLSLFYSRDCLKSVSCRTLPKIRRTRSDLELLLSLGRTNAMRGPSAVHCAPHHTNH